MRAASVLTFAAGATLASAQALLPTQIGPLSFSSQCQGAIFQLFSGGDFAQCMQTQTLLPFVTQNASLTSTLDMFMSGICYNQPCSNQTLQMAQETILNGCSADLQKDGYSNKTVIDAFNAYPVVREVLCTKTDDPYTNTSYGGFLGNPPVAIDSGMYNSTDGYFCVTSLLTQLTAYFDAKFTLPYLEYVAMGKNQTAEFLLKQVNPNILCNECIYAMIDIVEAAYPKVANLTADKVLHFLQMQSNSTIPMPSTGMMNSTMMSTETFNDYLNQTCAYKMFDTQLGDGKLPANVTVSIVNSTFSADITPGYMSN